MNDETKIGFFMQLLLRMVAAADDGLQAGANLAVTIPGIGYGIAIVIPMVVGAVGIIIFGLWFLLLPGRTRNGGKKLLLFMLMGLDCIPFLDGLPITSFAVDRLIDASQPKSKGKGRSALGELMRVVSPVK